MARELEVSGALCLAFANTGTIRRDDRRRASAPVAWATFRTYSDLVSWVQRMGESLDGERLNVMAAQRPAEARQVLTRGLALRSALLRTFTGLVLGNSPRPEDMRTLNAVLSQAMPARRLVEQAEGFGWEWAPGDEALERVLWPVAQSAADLMTSDQLRRLRQCATNGCSRIFIDRRGRRLWCDMNTCGSRAKGRRQQESARQSLLVRAFAARSLTNGGPSEEEPGRPTDEDPA